MTFNDRLRDALLQDLDQLRADNPKLDVEAKDLLVILERDQIEAIQCMIGLALMYGPGPGKRGRHKRPKVVSPPKVAPRRTAGGDA